VRLERYPVRIRREGKISSFHPFIRLSVCFSFYIDRNCRLILVIPQENSKFFSYTQPIIANPIIENQNGWNKLGKPASSGKAAPREEFIKNRMVTAFSR
jgi:hypothetical protein